MKKFHFQIHLIYFVNPNYLTTRILLQVFIWLTIFCEVKPDPGKNGDIDNLYLSILNSINDYHYFPQVAIPFTSSVPKVCTNQANSKIQIACYNWTNTQLYHGTFGNENFLTHFLPEVNSWNELINLVTLSNESLTSTHNQYKWIVVYKERNIKDNSLQNLTSLLKQALLTASFRIENPINIKFWGNEANSENVSSIQAYKMDLAAGTQTNIIFGSDSYHILPSEMTLNGSELFVAGVTDEEYDFDTKIVIDSQNRMIFESGFAVEILHALQDILNFSVNVLNTTDWGSTNEKTGEWQGMIAAVLKGEADLGLSSSANNRRRSKFVDYNIHTHINTVTAFFKKSSGLSMNPLLLPFQLSLWGSIVVWMCISKFMYIFIQKIIFHLLTHKEGNSVSEVIFPWIVAPITARGHPDPPSVLPLRALYFSELIVAVILNAAFSGTLISYLSMDYNPIRTVADIVKSDFKIEMFNYQIIKQNLKESEDPNTKNLYWKSEMYNRPNKDTVSPVKEIMKGKFVYVVDHLGGYAEITQLYNPVEACNIQGIPIRHQDHKQGSFVRKGAQLRKIIDYGLLKIMESGLNGVFKIRYLHHAPLCDTHSKYTGADMVDLQLAFLLLLGGYILSFTICLLEIVWIKLFPPLWNFA